MSRTYRPAGFPSLCVGHKGQTLSRAVDIRRLARAVTIETLELRTLLSGSIGGSVWNDADGNGMRDNNETGLSGWTVYLDQNRNATRDAGEAATTTVADGTYTFTSLNPGAYYVAQEIPLGWDRTAPVGSVSVRATSAAGAPEERPIPITTTGSSQPVHVSGYVANGPTPVPQDAESGPLIKLDQYRADARYAGVNGAGYSVAVIDTGIDVDHSFFGPDANGNGVADRIVYQYDFADDDADASDVDGHGSNVSSIVAGSSTTYSGVAPAAGIVALKVFPDVGYGSFAYVESALQWIVANATTYNIAAVNLSLGDSLNWSTTKTLYGLNDEFAALASKNVIVVSAAGNEYYNYQAQGVAYPAADPNVLAVGAVYDANVGAQAWGSGARDNSTAADRVISFSQRSTSLVSTFAPGGVISGADASGGTTAISGTSQAAPHVAGAAVLAQQLAVQNLGRRLAPAEFRQLLSTSGDNIYDGDDENDNVTNSDASYKRLNVKKLADAIMAMAAPAAPVGEYRVILADNAAVTNVNFGNRPRDLTIASAPALTAAADSGVSSDDRVTNFDNRSTAAALAFTVDGVLNGATVRLYANGLPIGSAVASTSTVVVTTDGTTLLSDGANVFTVRQFVPTLPESTDSPATTVTIDTVVPVAPPAPDLVDASDTGPDSTDNVTDDVTPAFALDTGGAAYFAVHVDGVKVGGDYESVTPYTLAALPNGVHTVAIAAVDEAGNASAPGEALSVTIATAPPVVQAGGPYAVNEGATLALAASATAASGRSLSAYEWDFDYDGVTFGVDANGATPAFSAATIDGTNSSSRTLGVRVRDDGGGVSDVAIAAVAITNVAPSATFSAGPAVKFGTASTVAFTGATDASRADVTAGLRYSFDFNNDGDFVDAGDVYRAASASGTYTFASAGTFTVRGRVEDKDAGTRDYATSVTVNPATTTTTRERFEAETATRTGGTGTGSQYAGFTGSGYADYTGNGSAVQWAVDRAKAGTVKLEFRYANGGKTNRPLAIGVNGVNVGSIACVPTGSWGAWRTVSIDVPLRAGRNAVRAVAGSASGGNVDSMTVVSTVATQPPAQTVPPIVLQAEVATLGGGTVVSKSNPGYTGTGFADFGGKGSFARFSITRGAAGTAKLELRYANGGTSTRPSAVIVNGTNVGSVFCAPTGSWASWKTVSIDASLLAGGNTIQFTASTSAGGGDVDSLTVSDTTSSPSTPPPTSDPAVTIQAETASRSGGATVGATNAGFTGSGYVNLGKTGNYVEFTVNRATAGPTKVKIRYGNGGTADRPASVTVNGVVKIASVPLARTGAWATWKEVIVTLDLVAGANVIRIASTSASGANLDAITVG